MEARRTEDLYRRAEQQLTAVATGVQRRDEIDLDGLSELATAIAAAVRHNDQLVVYALAGPSGPPLVTNLLNVGILSAKVGTGLGYYGQELQRLVLAGLVHDIGLFAVPQSLVAKPGRLSLHERMLIEQHPELGYHVIGKAGAAWQWLAQVVRQAHERWNGQGYPNKLKGRDISELAQIIGAVDVFDALVTPRPYRRRFFPDEGIRELIVAERMAFPREIVKAMVQQLSAYPLGTLVRLTTGEVGTVVRINADFPLRPLVEIGRRSQGSGQESRQLDLSRLPLVSIIETLEPPDLARVASPADRPGDRRTKFDPSVSNQFCSLLESLDAMTSAIQDMVKSRAMPPQSSGSEPVRSETQWSLTPRLIDDHADQVFEKEVIGLFAFEAYEWLAQIHSALRQLGEGTNGMIRSKLCGIMLQGLTSLAKSAAKVHQPAIERLASSLLPIVQDVDKQESHAMTDTLASLQAGLDRIDAAVRHAAGDREVQQPLPLAIEGRNSEESEPAEDEAVAPRPSQPPLPAVLTSGDLLLNALRELQQVRSRSVQPARDVLESVILRAEQQSGHLTVAGVRDILTELDRNDEAFLEEVKTRVPLMSRTLTAVRETGAEDFVTASQLDPIMEQVEALHDAASRLQAGMITMLLQGLRSFLLVAAYRKTTSLAQRLEAVEERIQSLTPMAEQWVAIGRVERAAIADILPS